MLQTLERTVLSAEPTCETRLLGAGDAPALRAFCGAALPLLPAPGLGPALHGGRLTVANAEGGGALVTVELPVKTQ